MDQISQFYFSKKAIKILLSLSLFSFVISYSSLLSFLLSTFSMRILYFFNDRNYIFILCNGIVVFVIKSSGLIQNSPRSNEFKDDNSKKNSGFSSSLPDIKSVETEAKKELGKEILFTKPEGKSIKKSNFTQGEDQEEEQFLGIEEDEDQEKDRFLRIEEGEDQEEERFLSIEEDEEEGIELLSADELNKKCDDFIKKMREGIKTEAQQFIMFGVSNSQAQTLITSL